MTPAPPVPPKPGRLFGLLLIAVFLVGLGGVCFIAVMQTNRTSPYLLPVFLSALIGSVLALGVGIIVQGRKTARELDRFRQDLAAHLGLDYVGRPSEAQKQAALVPIAHVKGVRDMPRAVKWYMAGELSGRPTVLVFHQYMVSHGHGAHSVTHVIAASACPPEWPELTLTQSATPTFDKLGLGVLRRWLAKPTIELESEAFNGKWRVRCDSEDFALCALTPRVQEWLAGAPLESWSIGRGMACCIRTSAKEADLAALVQRPPRLLDLIDAALAAPQ